MTFDAKRRRRRWQRCHQGDATDHVSVVRCVVASHRRLFANYDSQHQLNCCNYTDLLTPKWTVCSPQRKAFGFLGFLNFRIFLIVKFEFSIHDRRRVAAGACTLIGDHSQTLPSHAHIAETIFLMLSLFEYLYQKLIYFPALFLSTQMNDLDFKKLHHPHEGNSYFHDLLSRSYLQHCV